MSDHKERATSATPDSDPAKTRRWPVRRFATALFWGVLAATVPLALLAAAAIITGALFATVSAYSAKWTLVWIGWLLVCGVVFALAKKLLQRARGPELETAGCLTALVIGVAAPLIGASAVTAVVLNHRGVVETAVIDRECIHGNQPSDGVTSYSYHFQAMDGIDGEVDTQQRRLPLGTTITVRIDPAGTFSPRLDADVKGSQPGIIDIGFAAAVVAVWIGFGVLVGRSQYRHPS